MFALLDRGSRGDAARRALIDDPDWTAPAHTVLEVLRTLRRHELSGSLSQRAASSFAAEVQSAQVRRHPADDAILDVAWRYRHDLSPYDAPYVALAQLYAAPLVTNDERLARAARALGVTVVVPGADPPTGGT